jgi:hypothetical protein
MNLSDIYSSDLQELHIAEWIDLSLLGALVIDYLKAIYAS